MSAVEQQRALKDLIPSNDRCGGDYDAYSFGQTDREVSVYVPLEPGTTGKMICVDITPTTLSVGLRGKEAILSGKLYKYIKAEDSTWFIEDRKVLVVTLAKANLQYEEWWPHVVEGERQVDLKTLKPPEVHIRDLDAGAQATVERMMFDQRQKQAGLPTSDEMRFGAPPS